METNARRKRTTRWTVALILLVGAASGAGAAAATCYAGPICGRESQTVLESDPVGDEEQAPDRRWLVEPVTQIRLGVPPTWVESRGENGTAYFDPDESTDGTVEGAEVGIEIAIEEGPSSDLERWSELRGEQFVGYVFLQRGFASLGGDLVWRHDYVADVGERRLSVVEYAVAYGDGVLRVSTYRPAGSRGPEEELEGIARRVVLV